MLQLSGPEWTGDALYVLQLRVGVARVGQLVSAWKLCVVLERVKETLGRFISDRV